MNLTQADFKQSQYYGYYVTPKNGNVNIRKYPGTKEPIIKTMVKGEKGGTVMALYNKKVDDYSWYYIKLKEPVGEVQYGFVATSVIKVGKVTKEPEQTSTANTATDNDEETAKKLINNVIQRDVIIYKRLITAYWILVKLKESGKNVDTQMKVLQALAIRYIDRQKTLKEIEKKKETVFTFNIGPAKFNLQEIYEEIRNKLGLGVIEVAIPAAVFYVVLAIGSAWLTIEIMRLCRPAYDAQTADLKLTGEFGKYIKDLPDGPAKQNAIADVEQQIDDAYNAGKADGSSSSSWAWIKNGAIVVFSVWGFTKLLDMSESWRSKKNVGLRKT